MVAQNWERMRGEGFTANDYKISLGDQDNIHNQIIFAFLPATNEQCSCTATLGVSTLDLSHSNMCACILFYFLRKDHTVQLWQAWYWLYR